MFNVNETQLGGYAMSKSLIEGARWGALTDHEKCAEVITDLWVFGLVPYHYNWTSIFRNVNN
jgi:hypothetical protein